MNRATENQRAALSFFQIRFSENISFDEASAILERCFANPENKKAWAVHRDASAPAKDEEKDLMKFFKIPFEINITQSEAAAHRKALLQDPANKKRWQEHNKNKPATKAERETLAFFNQPIPKGMTTTEAQKIIKQLLANPDNLARQKAEEDRQLAIDDLFDELNCSPEDYDCKKISRKRFDDVLDHLLNAGFTVEMLYNDEDIFYAKAFELYPELKRADAWDASEQPLPTNNAGQHKTGCVILFLPLFVVVYFVVKECLT